MVKCSSCGRELRDEDFRKKWNKCEFCGDPICIGCSHYVGAEVKDLWKDFISVRRVCKKCVIKF